MNYKEEDKNLVQKSGKYRYYNFSEDIIKQIVNKNMKEVTNEEWRTLLQMI